MVACNDCFVLFFFLSGVGGEEGDGSYLKTNNMRALELWLIGNGITMDSQYGYCL